MELRPEGFGCCIVCAAVLTVACNNREWERPILLGQDEQIVDVILDQSPPEEILRRMLEWDTAGERFRPPVSDVLDRVYCYMPEEDCLSEEPGWDVARIVSGYRFWPLFLSADSAEFAIEFDRIGFADVNGIDWEDGIEFEIVWFRRIGDRWRIVNPESQLPPNIGVRVARLRYGDSRPD